MSEPYHLRRSIQKYKFDKPNLESLRNKLNNINEGGRGGWQVYSDQGKTELALFIDAQEEQLRELHEKIERGQDLTDTGIVQILNHWYDNLFGKITGVGKRVVSEVVNLIGKTHGGDLANLEMIINTTAYRISYLIIAALSLSGIARYYALQFVINIITGLLMIVYNIIPKGAIHAIIQEKLQPLIATYINAFNPNITGKVMEEVNRILANIEDLNTLNTLPIIANLNTIVLPASIEEAQTGTGEITKDMNVKEVKVDLLPSDWDDEFRRGGKKIKSTRRYPRANKSKKSRRARKTKKRR